MVEIYKLTDDLSVAPQLSPADVAGISKNFKSILCNRPDGEGGVEQPLFTEIEKLAKEAGMTVAYQPVNGSEIRDVDVDDFEDQVSDLPTPVLAYCRSGTRCTVLWSLSEAGKQSADDIIKTAGAAGFAMDALRSRIVDRE